MHNSWACLNICFDLEEYKGRHLETKLPDSGLCWKATLSRDPGAAGNGKLGITLDTAVDNC